ncbi:hypothetical protein BHE74_00056751 [Ensete ventricosum]|nr:hypothetical protein BHE74_00056751 [Ensete ventricosum]
MENHQIRSSHPIMPNSTTTTSSINNDDGVTAATAPSTPPPTPKSIPRCMDATPCAPPSSSGGRGTTALHRLLQLRPIIAVVDGGDGVEDIGREGEIAREKVEGADQGLGLLSAAIGDVTRVLCHRRRHSPRLAHEPKPNTVSSLPRPLSFVPLARLFPCSRVS